MKAAWKTRAATAAALVITVVAGGRGEQRKPPPSTPFAGDRFDVVEKSIPEPFEQSARPRRGPWSTPALVGRKAPAPIPFVSRIPTQAGSTATAPGLAVTFVFDPITSELRFNAASTGARAEDLSGAWIQRGAAGENGPALFQLLGHGKLQRSGAVTLAPPERARLLGGRLYLAFYTRSSPGGEARVQITVPVRP